MEQKIRRDRNMGDNLRRLRIDSHVSFFAELKNALCYSFFCIQFASPPYDIS